MSKELNCTNCCIGDFKESLCDCNNGICKEYKKVGKSEDFENEVLKRTKTRTAPTIDAVEVVRCKDCKYWHSNTEFCDVWSCLNVAQRTLADDYCSRGERREESEVEE